MSARAAMAPGNHWSLWVVLRFYAEKFLSAHHMMTQLGYAANEFHAGKVSSVHPDAIPQILSSIGILIPLLDELDLPLSAVSARALKEYFTANQTPAALALGADLARRMHDELATKYCFALSPKERSFFEQTSPFGSEVESRFQDASEDISEASKCLGLGRYTASVFHVMRALEHAMQVVAIRLGAAIQDQHGRGLGWGVIADNMKPKIDSMTKGSEEQIRWYRAQQHLVVINRAWRVPTNHPKQTYTADQACEVFDAAKAFMRELAELV